MIMKKVMNGQKVVFKSIGFFTKENNESVIHKWKFMTCVWSYKYDINRK